MADVYVMAEHEQQTHTVDYALLVPLEALEMMFPGGVDGFTGSFDAALIPDLNAFAIIGVEAMRTAQATLEEHGFEYNLDMVAIEAEINLYGPRRIHLLMSQEEKENRRGIERGGAHGHS